MWRSGGGELEGWLVTGVDDGVVQPGDFVRQSMPFSYLYLEATSNDGNSHSVQVRLAYPSSPSRQTQNIAPNLW